MNMIPIYWTLILFNFLDGVLNSEWGTIVDHYGKNLNGLKANRGDVLQKTNNDLILIFHEMRYFQMQYIEPARGEKEVRCHFYIYPRDWSVELKKVRRPTNPTVTFALATKFADKYLPFDPVHCNRRHYMHYILYGEIARSKHFKECPLAAPLAGITVDQIKNQLFKLMDSNGKLHDFFEYAISKKYEWPDWAAAKKRASMTERRNSCKRMVRRIFAFLGGVIRPKSSETILKRVKLEAFNGRPPLRYRIQLVDKYTLYEATLFMEKHYLHGQNLNESLVYEPDDETTDDTDASDWVENLAKGFSVAAFLEDKQGNRGPMIGGNVLSLDKKDLEETKDGSQKPKKVTIPEANTPRCRTDILAQTEEDLRSKVDVFTLYNCSSYMRGAGLTVAENYRGRGIATELIRAREQVSRVVGLPVDATVFDGAASQKAAQKCGYTTISEIDLRTYKINGRIVYPNPKTPVIKLMAKRYY